MKNNAPLVSICIPAYNAERFIRATLESALGQQYPKIEIVVSDDASTDRTAEVVAGFGSARVQLIRQAKNLGRSQNCNAVIAASRGKYVVKLDADDILEPDYVSSMIPQFEADPTITFAHCACRLIDIDGKPIGYERSLSGSFVRDGLEEWPRYVFGARAVNIVTIRRSTFDDVGGYDPRYLYSGDWAMHRALLKRGRVFYNDSVLASYRIHSLGKQGLQLLQARERLMHLEDIAADWPEQVPDRERLLAAARDFNARIVLKSAAFVDAAEREQIVKIVRRYGGGRMTRLLAATVIHGGAPLIRLEVSARLWLRQRIKSLVYQWKQFLPARVDRHNARTI